MSPAGAAGAPPSGAAAPAASGAASPAAHGGQGGDLWGLDSDESSSSSSSSTSGAAAHGARSRSRSRSDVRVHVHDRMSFVDVKQLTESLRAAMASQGESLKQLNIDEPHGFTSARHALDVAYTAMASLNDDVANARQQLSLAFHLISGSQSD
eukprot:909078-Pyramimonas_sp.AAC.1